jgi:hypothetical protein
MTASVKTIGDAAETLNEAQRCPSAPAVRMRRHRERRRRGCRCLTVELRDSEIEALIRRGLLNSETRNSTRAIAEALYRFLDRNLTAPL